MHDLVRAYAATTAYRDLTEQARQAALGRVLDFYTHTACTAQRTLEPHHPPVDVAPPTPAIHPHQLSDRRAALGWLEIEHHNLLAAQQMAAAHARHETVWHLAWSLTHFHQRQGHHHDQLAMWRVALDAAAHLPEPATGIHTHRALGIAYSDLGLHEEGVEHLDQALTLAAHDPSQRARTHRMLAWVWERRGHNELALEHATNALHLHQALDDPVEEANTLSDMGWYAARLGHYDAARLHCHNALTVQRHHHNLSGEANTLEILGHVEDKSGHHHRAVRYFQQAIALLQELGYTYYCADIREAVGHPLAALGEHDHARSAWREALAMYRQQGRESDAEEVLRQLDALDRAETPTSEGTPQPAHGITPAPTTSAGP
jgi:tetratricopeptide (TPR) repeat protein